jgi:hypothetical protein
MVRRLVVAMCDIQTVFGKITGGWEVRRILVFLECSWTPVLL